MRTAPTDRPVARGRPSPLVTLALAATLSACGMKGDLYLPPPAPAPAPAKASAPPGAQASPAPAPSQPTVVSPSP